MPYNFFNGIKTSLLVAFCVLTTVSVTHGQVGDQDRRTFMPQRDHQLIFPSMVDEFGLAMSLDQMLMEEYIDKETYILGPGDMFSIDLKGEITRSVRGIVVNGEGYIFIPGVGQVDVKELSLVEAREKIDEQISEQFQNTEISVSLDRPRPVMVNVHGDIESPGKYIVPYQTRVDQAIYPALTGELPHQNNDEREESPGMVSYTQFQYSFAEIRDMPQSLRNIQVISDNGEEQTADLISYLRKGDKDANPFVRDGDVIHVQRKLEEGPKISISGGVSTHLDLEYRQGDNLGSLIDIAGGFSSDADTSKIHLYRRQGNEIVQHDINPNSENLYEFDVEPNDKIIVPIDRDLHQSQIAHANGEVEIPGRYPIVDGETTVYDLLEMTGGPTSRALTHGAYLIRSEAGGDRTLKEPQPAMEQLMRTSDQYRQGFEYLELEAALSRNQVHVDLENEEQLKNTRLYSEDQLYIPKDENTIFMMGQVNNPGHYTFNDNTSAESYINQAGGYAMAAEESRVFIIKAGSRSWYHPGETDLESGDIIFVDRVPFDDLQARRSYRQGNIQLILTGISTIASVITTYIAVFR